MDHKTVNKTGGANDGTNEKAQVYPQAVLPGFPLDLDNVKRCTCPQDKWSQGKLTCMKTIEPPILAGTLPIGNQKHTHHEDE
jgi:hypothetical protein